MSPTANRAPFVRAFELKSHIARPLPNSHFERRDYLTARLGDSPGWRTAIVDPGPNAPDTLIGSTIAGQKVIQCPVTTGKSGSCEECRLCGRDLPIVIAFPVHGSKKMRATEAVRRIRNKEVA